MRTLSIENSKNIKTNHLTSIDDIDKSLYILMESSTINTNRKGVDGTDDSEQEITNGAVLIEELTDSARPIQTFIKLTYRVGLISSASAFSRSF